MAHWQDGRAVLRVGADPTQIPVEIAASYAARTRGLLGRDGIDGAMLLTPAASVHTFRMRFAIDVAYLDRDFRVLAVVTMEPGRLGLPGSAPGTSWRRRRARRPGGACGSEAPSRWMYRGVSRAARRCTALAVGWGG